MNQFKEKVKRNILFVLLIVILMFSGCQTSANNEISIDQKIELAYQYLTEQNYEQAELVFEEIISIDPKIAIAYVGLSETYMGQEKLEDAEIILIDAMSVFQNRLDDEILVGEKLLTLYNIFGDDDKAFEMVLTLLEKDPNNQVSIETVESMYAYDWSNLLEVILENGDKDYIALEMIAQYKLGNYDEVIRLYEEADRGDVDDLLCLYAAVSYQWVGRDEQAKSMIEDFKYDEVEDVYLLNTLAEYYMLIGADEIAIKICEKVISLNDSMIESYEKLYKLTNDEAYLEYLIQNGIDKSQWRKLCESDIKIEDTQTKDGRNAGMPAFVDIIGGTFRIENGKFHGEIILANIPGELTFNHPDLQINGLEYLWEFRVETASNVYQMGLSKFKFEDEVISNSIVDECQADIWELSGTGFTRIGEVHARIDGDKMVIDGKFDNPINPSDILAVSILTYYDNGINIFEDSMVVR